ncbi:replication-relaxation family protein [Streptococcus suis]|uniref:replication-relaxation family protein n=1 Tax=Streptococcus suis TaxID=1307 RepID=UPI000CF3760B|nr:replication-relaxation family protein [Streptococcus suis]
MRLTKRDYEVLSLLNRCRYATTKQLVELYFRENKPKTATRRANLLTKKLLNLGLIHHLERRVGGVRAGSGSYIWFITHKGIKELRKIDPSIKLRLKNRYEPTRNHLKHQLFVTQIFVELKILDADEKMLLENFSFEPKCWRSFATLFSHFTLKPDAFARLTIGNFEDAYFFEADNATEHLGRVVAKCKQYIAYYNTGIEQRENCIFPMIVWIVPDEKRKMALETRIREDLDAYWELFSVITLDEFSNFIQGGQDD